MEPDIAFVAGLIGDPARARMLTALMGGRALTATELTLEADITAQTASSHLAKLVDGQLLVVRKQGRHRYFQLQDAEIAGLLETLLAVTSAIDTPRAVAGPADPALRRARVCYDHLAGEMGVALYDGLVASGYLLDRGQDTALTDSGRIFFKGLGIDFSGFENSRRPLCKSCLDWSERRNHLAGHLGQWILNDLLARSWANRDPDSRAIRFSPKGVMAFSERYGIDMTW